MNNLEVRILNLRKKERTNSLMLCELTNKEDRCITSKESLLSDFIEKFQPNDLSTIDNYDKAFNLLDKACILLELRIKELALVINYTRDKIEELELKNQKENDETKS